MKKTKIVCTMGPNSNDENIMRQLVKEGMDIARFNFSHGSHEEQKGRMDMLKKIREEEKKPVAILLDTKGPEIRTGVLKDGKKVLLKEGETITLTNEEIEGDETKVSLTYKGLVDDVQIGNMILIDDGLIGLKVKEKTETDIICTIVNGGELGERKGVNVPNVPVRLPAITEKDKEDLKFGVEQKIDFIAASFVRNAECILEIRSYLNKCGAPYIPIIAKIENSEGIDNIDEIIRCADGIMVASYYLYSNYIAGFFPRSYAMIWFGFTAVSPLLAFVCWYAKGKSKLAFILSALILAVLFNMCFVYGCWYFNAKSVLEVIVFIIGLIVLRRDTLRSSALMGTISIVLAVLLDMVIPFHFG